MTRRRGSISAVPAIVGPAEAKDAKDEENGGSDRQDVHSVVCFLDSLISMYAPANQIASGISVFARKYAMDMVPLARHSSRIAKTSQRSENSLASAAAFTSIETCDELLAVTLQE